IWDQDNRRKPVFSNTWKTDRGNVLMDLFASAPQVVDADDPLRYNVTVTKGGSIETDSFGKIMLFGPQVTNAGRLHVKDEGQIVLAAGENIYLEALGGNSLAINARTGAWNPLGVQRDSFTTTSPEFLSSTVSDAAWQDFYEKTTGVRYPIGY